MRVLVSGSHGLIGGALAASLRADGHEVTPLVRGLPKTGEAGWDPKEGTVDAGALEGHDAVVHLAGAGIGSHRWTAAYKEEILHSRVNATALLAGALAKLDRKPVVLVGGSAVGYYGDQGDAELDEDSPPGGGFLADVTRRWEASSEPAEAAGIRVVRVRTGIVQSPHADAVKRLLVPFKLGIGGRWGSGRQWLSWVHIDDEVGAIRFALDHDDVRGSLNACAPNPVTVSEYTKAFGRAVHRPAVLPTPTAALYAVVGKEMATEMLLGGQRVLPRRLLAAGYRFRYPKIDGALAAVFG